MVVLLALGGFNRPKAISCLATRTPARWRLTRDECFNRPKAISCLATRKLLIRV